MELDDPLSIAVSELYYDLSPNYDPKCRSNGPSIVPMALDSGQCSSSNFMGEAIVPSDFDFASELDQFTVSHWSDSDWDQNGFQSDEGSFNYDPTSPSSSSSSTTNSHDQSSPVSSALSHCNSWELSFVQPAPAVGNGSLSSLKTESTSSFSPSLVSNDKQSNRDIELLQLFESSVFNSLLEDNFIKISLQDEALAVESGLRQLELNKYHELAKVVDLLYGNRNMTVNQDEQTDRFQIAIVHKHTEMLINTVKRITSFNNICLDDQISLLKSRFIDLCMIKSLIYIEPETRTIKINGQRISMERCLMMNNENFIQLTSSIDPILRSDPIINLLILLIALLNPNITTNLRSTFSVRKEYILTIHLVQKYLELRGFTINQANYEIKNLICNLENFLEVFNGKQKVQDVARRHLGYTSQLIAEMLDLNGQQPP